MNIHDKKLINILCMVIILFCTQLNILCKESEQKTISTTSKVLGIASLVTLTGTGIRLYKLYSESCEKAHKKPTIKNFKTFIRIILKNLANPLTRLATIHQYPAIFAALTASGAFAGTAIINQLLYKPKLKTAKSQPATDLPAINVVLQNPKNTITEIIKYVEVPDKEIEEKYEASTKKISLLEAQIEELQAQLKTAHEQVEKEKLLSHEELTLKGIHGLETLEITNRNLCMLEEEISRKQIEQQFLTKIADKNNAQTEKTNTELKKQLQEMEAALAQLKAELIRTKQELKEAEETANKKLLLQETAHRRTNDQHTFLLDRQKQAQHVIEQQAALVAQTAIKKQERLSVELQRLQIELQRLQAELENKTNQQRGTEQQLRQQIAALQNKLLQAQTNAAQKKEQLTQAQKQENAVLRSLVDTAKEKLTQEKAALNKTIAALKNELEELKKQKKIQATALEQELRQRIAAEQELHQKIVALERRLENNFLEEAEQGALRKRITDLEKQLSVAQEEKQNLTQAEQRKIDELRRLLDQSRQALTQGTATLTANNKTLAEKLAKQEREMQIKDRKIRELEQQQRDQEDASSSSDDEDALAELRTQLKQKDELLKKTQRNLLDRTISKEAYEERIRDAKSVLEAERAQNRKDKEALERALQNLKALKEDKALEKFGLELQKHSAEIADREAARRAAECAKSQQETTTAQKNEELARKLREADKEQKALTKKIDDLEKKLQAQRLEQIKEIEEIQDKEKARIKEKQRVLFSAQKGITKTIDEIETEFNVYGREMGAITDHCDRIRREEAAYVHLPAPFKCLLERFKALKQQLQRALNLVSP